MKNKPIILPDLESKLYKKLKPIIQEWLNTDISELIQKNSAYYKRDDHETINNGITAQVEEKLKVIICPKIPKWVSPDILTALGLVAITITATGYIMAGTHKLYLILVVAGLFLHWFGDSFDGSIARYRKRTRPKYGYYIDHIIDAIAVIIYGVGIGYSDFFRIDISLIFVCMYLALETHTLLVKSIENTFKYSFGLFGPTEIRIIGVIVAVYIYFSESSHFTVFNSTFTQYDIALGIVDIVMFCILITNIISKGIQLHKEDTRKWDTEK